jgi:hypothetical protein
MTTSINIVGFKAPDERYQKYAKVFHACTEAGVEPPEEVARFFEDSFNASPDPAGHEVNVPSTHWEFDMCQGLEVQLDQVPAGVKSLRFYIAY